MTNQTSGKQRLTPARAILYGTMAVGVLTPKLPVLVNGLLIHAFGVGLPSALAARRAATLNVGSTEGVR